CKIVLGDISTKSKPKRKRHSIINVCLPGQIHLERGLFMNTIISKIYTLIHQTDNLIDFEESVRILMYDVFASMLGDIFTKMNTVIVNEKQSEGWTVERNDEREIQFTFGAVRFTHTLMYDLEGNAH